MTELKNWKTLHKKESWGGGSFGVEIRVAVDREFTENDDRMAYQIADEIEDKIRRETLRLDPAAQAARQEKQTKLLECFGERRVFAEEIPNGYSDTWYYSQSPWFKVTTVKGVVTLGWRKRVIEIKWEPGVNIAADQLFPDEDVTKYERLIHAWSYEKAKQYITKLLQTPEHNHPTDSFPKHITRSGAGVWDKSCPACAALLNS